MGSALAAAEAGTLMPRLRIAASILMLLAVRGVGAQAAIDSIRPIRWPAVAAVTGVVAASLLLDRPTTRAIHDHPSTDRRATADHLARFGTIGVIGPTVGALAVTGLLTHRPALTNLALNTSASIVVATIAVEGVKLSAGRKRPYDDPDLGADDFSPFSGNASFPSGHTTAAFAFATTLGDAIDRPWARVGLYALATGTAWARVAQEAHWVSDVVAGAALGIAASKFASRRRTVFGLRAPRIGVSPHALVVQWDGLPWQPRSP
jgi:membrane-associated phospholipid phosphatase